MTKPVHIAVLTHHPFMHRILSFTTRSQMQGLHPGKVIYFRPTHYSGMLVSWCFIVSRVVEKTFTLEFWHFTDTIAFC